MNAFNGDALKTKGALCLWECTLIAAHTLEHTHILFLTGPVQTRTTNLSYGYIVARECLDVKITNTESQNKYNKKVIDVNIVSNFVNIKCDLTIFFVTLK